MGYYTDLRIEMTEEDKDRFVKLAKENEQDFSYTDPNGSVHYGELYPCYSHKWLPSKRSGFTIFHPDCEVHYNQYESNDPVRFIERFLDELAKEGKPFRALFIGENTTDIRIRTQRMDKNFWEM